MGGVNGKCRGTTEHCNPQLVAISPHNSCDWTLDAFRKEFAGAYQDLPVGQRIIVQ